MAKIVPKRPFDATGAASIPNLTVAGFPSTGSYVVCTENVPGPWAASKSHFGHARNGTFQVFPFCDKNVDILGLIRDRREPHHVAVLVHGIIDVAGPYKRRDLPRCVSTASAASSFRSRWGSLRGVPVCSSHLFPFAAPQVEQGTEAI